MKIFIMVYNLTNGGAERVAALWANGFNALGNEVTVILGDDKSPITYKVDEGVRLKSICSNKSNKISRAIDRLKILRRLALKYRPDLIIGVLTTRALMAKIATLDLKIPIINTEHNSFERPKNAPMPMIIYFYKYVINRIYNHITVLTTADKKVIGHRLKNVTVLPNPCPFEPAYNIDLNNRKHIILASGRLNVWHCKGFDNLIRAFGEAKNKINSDWELHIAGQGPTDVLNYLKSICKEMGVEDSVKFLGYVQDIENKYLNSSVFVLSSRYEGFGMVLLEAMSKGCACIACDYKGRQREILGDPAAGLVCATDNIPQLAENIIMLCNDENLRFILQKRAIERSEDFQLPNIMKIWDNIISNLYN